ncbi:MAG: lipoyl(octanoyl) transferase LipB [Ignavibacteria bacterium]|nr:lipoyl(octanoyl) transferase LipB [Ignavibacteria bacterium]
MYMPKILIEDWSLIPFREAWSRQEAYVRDIQKGVRPSTLILCEHPPVLTIGREGGEQNVKIDPSLLTSQGIEMIPINRGGDITAHNLGQLIGYPLFNLSEFRQDLHWFLRSIEDIIMQVLEEYGIASGRVEGKTGVWIEEERKICAIGLHCSRWVTSHGFALNVNNDLSIFDWIIPCGIPDKEVTSIHRELGKNIDMEDLKEKCRKAYIEYFR